uniref:Mitochondrial complement component 1Q subcomponent-binding protein n=1 Tax=Glossina morsitans morsitans TaxID=37546 RepID=D3TLR5_GLOMM
MNNFTKAAARILRNTPVKNVLSGKRDFARTIWHLSKNSGFSEQQNFSVLQVHKPSLNCSCGCGLQHMHTKAERELVEFLTEEILAERKAQKIKTTANQLEGFSITYDGAEVELSKKAEKEKIIINFNVNHTVDTEEEPEVDPTADKAEVGEMRSKPRFEVDIIKGDTTLSFTCSYLMDPPQEGEYNDVFGIDELTIFKGEWKENIYAVSGDVLDGYLYDLLMNLLEEKGISSEFVEKMADLATAYEHSSYIALLENISKFTTGK